MKVYDRNHNELTVGQRVLISESGETDKVEAIHSDNLSIFDAQHQATVQIHAGTYAPIDLVRLG